jgi:hypothetical protein
MTTDELINGLKHMADDHPCCRLAIAVTIDRLSELERENEELKQRLEMADSFAAAGALLSAKQKLRADTLAKLVTALEVAGEGMSEECASQPHVAKWDAARGEVGSFLRSA